VSRPLDGSARAWRDIARQLASEHDRTKMRALMEELSAAFEQQFAACPVCNKSCDRNSPRTDGDGRPMHEECYEKQAGIGV